jgi:ATP synthase protein I
MRSADKLRAERAVKAQVAFTVVVSLALIFASVVVSYSALIGGLIATLANAYFAKQVFIEYRAGSTGHLLAKIYAAEIKKLVLVGALFAAAIAWIDPLSVGTLFSVFIIVHLVPSIMTLIDQ